MTLPLAVLRKLFLCGYADNACPNCSGDIYMEGEFIMCLDVCDKPRWSRSNTWEEALAATAAALKPFARQAESVIEEASEDEGDADEWFVTGLDGMLATVGDYRRLAALYKELTGEQPA